MAVSAITVTMLAAIAISSRVIGRSRGLSRAFGGAGFAVRKCIAAVDGVIARTLVARGKTVVRGQPLLRVDCDPRAAEVVNREAGAVRAAASAKRVGGGDITALSMAGPKP